MTELFNSNLPYIACCSSSKDVFKNLTQKVEALKNECYNFNQKLNEKDPKEMEKAENFFGQEHMGRIQSKGIIKRLQD